MRDERIPDYYFPEPTEKQKQASRNIMKGLRACGHARGRERWCPECELEEARRA